MSIIFSLFFLLLPKSLLASETSTNLDAIRVFGGRERLEKVTNSQTLGTQVLKEQKSTDVLKVLKQMPGVQVQEEDGMGLRPNIGMRGTHPHRSRKVVLMEDGILIGPAPYSAPAAYYSPSMLHTQNLEIFKGLAAVPYGPNSIGGAINYLTKDYPKKKSARAEFSAGSFGSAVFAGDMGTTEKNFSALLNGSHAATDGFKKLPDGANTGFRKNDFLLKTKIRAIGPEAELGLKLGYSDELSNETYLGLSADDFIKDPYVRYAASARDNLKWKHYRAQLDYQLALGMGTLKTSLYRHDFQRNWERLNGFRQENPDVTISKTLRSPFGTLEPRYLILTGAEDSASIGSAGDLSIVQNDRKFFSQGWQTEVWQEFSTKHISHNLTIGMRLHQDQIRTNHLNDFYSMRSGKLDRVTVTSLVTSKNENTALAKSLHMRDELKWRRWKGELAARFEEVNYTLEDKLAERESKKTVRGFAPGLGLGYQILPEWSVSSSVNRGLTLVGANAGENEGPEKSVNYELSSLYVNEEKEFQAEVAGFFNRYGNIKGTASFAGGATDDQIDQEYSGGEAKIYGIEARASKNLFWNDFQFPLRANFTALDARFSQTVESRNPEWGEGIIRPGDPLPYIPRWQFALGIGSQYKNFRQEFLIQYTGRVFDQAIARGRGEVPGYGIVDWTGRFAYSKGGSLFARMDNIFQKRYAVSWRPFGLRPGKPQSALVGIEQIF